MDEFIFALMKTLFIVVFGFLFNVSYCQDRNLHLKDQINSIDSITKRVDSIVLKQNQDKINLFIRSFISNKNPASDMWFKVDSSFLKCTYYKRIKDDIFITDYYFKSDSLIKVRFAKTSGFNLLYLGNYYYSYNQFIGNSPIEKGLPEPSKVIGDASLKLQMYKTANF